MRKNMRLDEVPLGKVCTVLACGEVPLVDVIIIADGHDELLQDVEIFDNLGLLDYVKGTRFPFPKGQPVTAVRDVA